MANRKKGGGVSTLSNIFRKECKKSLIFLCLNCWSYYSLIFLSTLFDIFVIWLPSINVFIIFYLLLINSSICNHFAHIFFIYLVIHCPIYLLLYLLIHLFIFAAGYQIKAFRLNFVPRPYCFSTLQWNDLNSVRHSKAFQAIASLRHCRFEKSEF